MSSEWNPPISTLEAGVGGLTLDDVSDDTVATKAHLKYDVANTKALVTPIYHTSAYRTDTVQEYLDILKSSGYIYSRLGNPTVEEAECIVRALEGAAGCVGFASGMAAITNAILTVCKAGDHIVCQNPIYSGTHKFMKILAEKFNMEYTWVPAGHGAEVFKKAMKENTKLLVGETPANPNISVLDLEAFASLAGSKAGVYTLVDATYATPYLLKPISFGIDMVVHSATKYLGGHHDLLAGVVSTKTAELWTELQRMRMIFGGCMSPFDATLLTRGLRTLPVRMARHCDNADKIAQFLNTHEKVAQVFHPSLSSHPNHSVAKAQMKRHGGMISFEMKGGLEPARRTIENLQLITQAVSLGGISSLMEHPATMTHGPMIMDDEERREAMVTDGLLRLSVGIEDADDIIKDLERAFSKA